MLAEIWCLSQLEIFREQLAKVCQRLILPFFCLYNYKYLSIVDIDLIGLNLEHHPVFEFRKKNVCFCHLSVFEQQSSLLRIRKNYFVDMFKFCISYFEFWVNFQIDAISDLLSHNLAVDFWHNTITYIFFMKEQLFSAFNVKAEPQAFEQL